MVQDGRPDSAWKPVTLYEGAEGLLPPDAGVSLDSEGRWVLLDAEGNPTTFRMPR